MKSQSDIYQIILMSIISFMTGIYAIWTGISTFSKGKLNPPDLYKFGAFISKRIRGEAQSSKVEKDINNPEMAVKYGIFWLLIGIAFLAGSFVLLFFR